MQLPLFIVSAAAFEKAAAWSSQCNYLVFAVAAVDLPWFLQFSLQEGEEGDNQEKQEMQEKKEGEIRRNQEMQEKKEGEIRRRKKEISGESGESRKRSRIFTWSRCALFWRCCFDEGEGFDKGFDEGGSNKMRFLSASWWSSSLMPDFCLDVIWLTSLYWCVYVEVLIVVYS